MQELREHIQVSRQTSSVSEGYAEAEQQLEAAEQCSQNRGLHLRAELDSFNRQHEAGQIEKNRHLKAFFINDARLPSWL